MNCKKQRLFLLLQFLFFCFMIKFAYSASIILHVVVWSCPTCYSTELLTLDSKPEDSTGKIAGDGSLRHDIFPKLLSYLICLLDQVMGKAGFSAIHRVELGPSTFKTFLDQFREISFSLTSWIKSSHEAIDSSYTEIRNLSQQLLP